MNTRNDNPDHNNQYSHSRQYTIDYLHGGVWALFHEDGLFPGAPTVLYDSPDLVDLARYAIISGIPPAEVGMSDAAELVVEISTLEEIARVRRETEKTRAELKKILYKTFNKETTDGYTEEDYTDYA